ncbi:helix-turn-helix domain-containing protein [Nonomuraea basaltis]|uniref:AraC-like ligand-binding domain-containing protein n=1 Tax=Nonomuraea basaltis TaxID=2495887 RepID=UPI001486EB5D|nr:helix-turn-helix domain-containing protein [Nonomuraea basaltis]
MGTVVIRLDGVPVKERFDVWWQMVAQSVVSVDASSGHADDFWAEMRIVDLGAIRLSRVTCSGFEAHRSTSRIRRSDPEAYQLSLTIHGRSGIRQEGRETELTSGDLALYDASHPFVAWSAPEDASTGGGPRHGMPAGLILHVPHDVLTFPASMVRRLLARRVPGHDGIGALLSGLLNQVMAQADHLSPTDLERLSGTVVDLLSAVLAHEAETDPSSFVTDPGALLVLRVQAFIERHLDEPHLSPSDIAAFHHVSLRHLQRLFGKEGYTISGWIQHRRLERCRRALADPSMDRLHIGVIAARWGFTSDAHFNRLFRRRYGVPPASYRRNLRKDAGDPSRNLGGVTGPASDG